MSYTDTQTYLVNVRELKDEFGVGMNFDEKQVKRQHEHGRGIDLPSFLSLKSKGIKDSVFSSVVVIESL
jgi:hypothetical protein